MGERIELIHVTITIILTTGLIQVANNKVYCKLGNGSVRDLTQDTNTIYTHPATKQCNYTPDLSSCLQGTPFTLNITAPSQQIRFYRTDNVIVTLNGATTFERYETFYIYSSSDCVLNCTIPKTIEWMGGITLNLQVYIGTVYNLQWVAMSSINLFTKSDWNSGTYTWTVPGNALTVKLSKAITKDHQCDMVCRFVAAEQAQTNDVIVLNSLSWQVKGVRFNI